MPSEQGRESTGGAKQLRLLSKGLNRDATSLCSFHSSRVFADSHDSITHINTPVAHHDASP